MPIYVYECSRGHRREETRRVEERDKRVRCVECAGDGIKAHFAVMRRVATAPASIFPGSKVG